MQKSRKTIKYSIIIPVYNEEATIEKVIKKVKAVPYNGNVEIIIVNDGSKDKTKKVLSSIKGVKVLHNQNNKGKGFSLRKAFKKAAGETIIIQDADLEYNPAEHLKLIKVLEAQKLEVVYGSRFKNKRPKHRYKLFYLGNLLLSLLTGLLYGKKITDMETCYKVISRKALEKIELKSNRFDFEPEITCKLLKLGLNIIEIPISYKSRSYKEGKKIGARDGLQAIYTLFRYRFFD